MEFHQRVKILLLIRGEICEEKDNQHPFDLLSVAGCRVC